MAKKKIEEVEDNIVEENQKNETVNEKIEKGIALFTPITEKVRETVLSFGEIIVTISVIIGLVTAVVGGLSDMANVGFFAGLSTMFSSIVNVIMGALVIFLLFAIYRNGEKKGK